ncbi:MAG: IS91 family transposase [Pseudomonadales bacterium]|nr:IS91 family transposase [Pseudomonadales bacterium]
MASVAAITLQAPTHYQRHQPEKTILYPLIRDNYHYLEGHLSQQGKYLPAYVKREFEEYLKCGKLENGFLRVRCEACQHERLVAFSCKKRGFCPSCGASRMAQTAALLSDHIFPHQPVRQWVLSLPFPLRFLLAAKPELITPVLKIIVTAISSALIKKAGFTRKVAETGAVTLLQRFGSALNLNIHFHMLFLDGVYIKTGGKPKFISVKAFTATELSTVLDRISRRLIRFLEKTGYLEKDAEQPYLNLDESDDSGMQQIQGCAITYRIAVGPLQGRKTLTLQTIPAIIEENYSSAVKVNGFSLHAGVVCQAKERKKLERLCRYISRGALSEKRLSLSKQGQVTYRLKTPYNNGTTHVVFSPMDFMARLAALIPPPRLNLTRYHGVFASNSKLRPLITNPKRKAVGSSTKHSHSYRMSWAERLKRVFNIDIEVCNLCGGKVKIIASIKDPLVIDKILTHLGLNEDIIPPAFQLPEAQGPSSEVFF